MQNGSVEPNVSVLRGIAHKGGALEKGLWSLLPILMLLVGLGLSGWMYWFLREEARRADQVHFDTMTRAANVSIAEGINVCANALHAGRAFFDAMPTMRREQWKAFAATQDMPNRYPGVRGLGVAYAVPANRVADFVTEIRADGRPEFAIREIPVGRPKINHAPDYPLYVISLMEPESAADAPVFGVNIAAEPSRCESLEKARDTMATVLSGQIFLITDSAKRSAFALYEPFYHMGLPTDTVQERKQAIRGWIYARLVMEDFLLAMPIS